MDPEPEPEPDQEQEQQPDQEQQQQQDGGGAEEKKGGVARFLAWLCCSPTTRQARPRHASLAALRIGTESFGALGADLQGTGAEAEMTDASLEELTEARPPPTGRAAQPPENPASRAKAKDRLARLLVIADGIVSLRNLEVLRLEFRRSAVVDGAGARLDKGDVRVVAALHGMQQKGAGRGGQGGQAQPNKWPHAEDVSRGSAKRATTSAEAAGVVQQPAAGQQEQEEEEDFVQKYEIEQLVTLALLEENMRDQHDRITVEWMTAFAGTHMAVYTYRKRQLTPAELAHLAELFWVNACFD